MYVQLKLSLCACVNLKTNLVARLFGNRQRILGLTAGAGVNKLVGWGVLAVI